MFNSKRSEHQEPAPQEAWTGGIWKRRGVLAAFAGLGFVLVGCSEGSTDSSSQPTRTPIWTPSPTAAPVVAPFSPTNKLVFSSTETGPYKLVLKDLVTKERTILTTGGSNDMNATPSPDGFSLAFYSDRAKGGLHQIFILSLVDGTIDQLTNDGASDYDPVFMPDGKHVLFKSNKDDGYGDIWIIGIDKSNPRNLTPMRPKTEEWSPFLIDEHTILFTSRATQGNPNSDKIYLLDLRTDIVKLLTDNAFPNWLPRVVPRRNSTDPVNFVYISKNAQGERDGIFFQNLADPQSRRRVTGLNLFGGDSDDPWATRSKVFFINNGNVQGVYAIYSINYDGTGIELVDRPPSGSAYSPATIGVS